MAKQTFTKTLSDLSGKENATTVTFSFQNTAYEIDLTKDETESFVRAIASFTDKARKVGGRRRRGTSTPSSVNTAAVREWAKSNGYELSDRGRIPANIMTAYEEAQSGASTTSEPTSEKKSSRKSSKEEIFSDAAAE